MVEITIEVDELLLTEAAAVCKQLGTTIEAMTEAFFRFSIIPENRSLLTAFLFSTGDIVQQERTRLKVLGTVYRMTQEL